MLELTLSFCNDFCRAYFSKNTPYAAFVQMLLVITVNIITKLFNLLSQCKIINIGTPETEVVDEDIKCELFY